MTKKKESINNEEVIELGEKEKLTEILSECYEVAEVECKKENIDDLIVDIGEEDSKVIIELANTKHACRGAALTLAIYKILHPEQDIRSHKAEYENGFSARGVDHSVTVPFLIQKGLPYNVDTHWLSQTLSYSQPYMPDVVLKTVPKKVGPDFIITVNLIQNSVSTERVKKITILILEKMIEERNKGNIPLTKPKNLSIDQVMEILHKQFSVNYEKNAPRLPQIAVYAMHTKFLKNDKHIIGDINNYLEQKYQCVRTGDCNGSVAFERRIMAEISPKADIETLDMNSFFESYEVIIKKLFNHYQVTNKKTERHMREEDFHDSVYMKCVDIATGLYYGSLMCNYYTNQFATYNNNQNKKRNHVG